MSEEELRQLWLDLEQAMGTLQFLTSIDHQGDSTNRAADDCFRLVKSARERVANEILRQELCT